MLMWAERRHQHRERRLFFPCEGSLVGWRMKRGRKENTSPINLSIFSSFFIMNLISLQYQIYGKRIKLKICIWILKKLHLFDNSTVKEVFLLFFHPNQRQNERKMNLKWMVNIQSNAGYPMVVSNVYGSTRLVTYLSQKHKSMKRVTK